jgi:hypothetical protein
MGPRDDTDELLTQCCVAFASAVAKGRPDIAERVLVIAFSLASTSRGEVNHER